MEIVPVSLIGTKISKLSVVVFYPFIYLSFWIGKNIEEAITHTH